MALTINSPGVQINEVDLSLYQQNVGGTNVFVSGFAPQGPTDEVILITSASELETVFGTPTTAAERYFYHTANQIINSPGTLLTTRLPYGSGSGDGFSNMRSITMFPMASATTGGSITNPASAYAIQRPIHMVISEDEYSAIIQGNYTWASAAPGTALSGYNGTGLFPNGSGYSFEPSIGLVILNQSQTTINEAYEGYYVAIADNSNFGPTTDFASVLNIETLSASQSFATIPSTRFDFALSGTHDTAGAGSVSEVIEGIPLYDFGSDYYQDSVVLTLFKLRKSIYDPSLFSISLTESYIGSFDINKKSVSPNGGIPKTFFIGDLINNDSSNMKAIVNPNISTNTIWTNGALSSINPTVAVTASTGAKALFAQGIYTPSYANNAQKEIGDVYLKVERALTLIDTPDDVRVDVVVDGGLSTIYATTSATGSVFDDTLYMSSTNLSNGSPVITRCGGLHNLFNNFVTNTRKDCMFIADPLRQIFVQGENTKVIDVKGNTFSQNVYSPLKSLFSTIDSNYCATYGNWIKTNDTASDRYVWVPASGFAAAAYARTDNVSQPWFAPAGFSRGNLYLVSDIAFNPNQKQRDFLYTISINPISLFPSDGYIIMGQKTLQQKPTAFDRINVRRLFLTLERAVQQTIKYFLFEPNTTFTQTRVKNSITPIFNTAKNTEGLYDFLIICDSRNNTPAIVDMNQLIVDIYIKPVKAAEFINVNFIATRTGQDFQELI